MLRRAEAAGRGDRQRTLLARHTKAPAASACTLGIEVTDISDRIRQDRAIPEYVAGAIVRVAGKGEIQAGDVFGCFNLGAIYHRGEVVKEDRARALTARPRRDLETARLTS